ncbi:glucose-1-phosphate adenylyltransferase [Haloplasma contractile]|uniref:Glucose-1-phosphate adenylyltransferase n=1 Tax=Haloplasma contractile SSD-17B TaxID=1033810 RepID=U2E7D4_9MOLU|nr:glucose-1-phosphate adenylyltransferase [Haloplasma contractile]ERJ11113.1 Glucose-1-phosphate adenylyltransferase protein [Haloplasma contractile SSD-17B]
MVSKEMIAILLAGGKGTRLKELTHNNAKPAIFFGAKYRMIDFSLSNCVNSGIDTIGVLTQYEPVELNSYVGIGADWDLDIGNGGVTVLPPFTSKHEHALWQNGTAAAVYQHRNYIDYYNPNHVLILSGDHVYKMDYQKMLDEHVANDADVTIASVEVSKEEANRFGILELDNQNRVLEFEEKPQKPKSNYASMGIYIFNWRRLKETLKQLICEQDELDFGKDVLPYYLNHQMNVYGYRFKGYWRDVGTIDSLWKTNMDLIDSNEQLNLKDKDWRIYSVNPNMPAHHIFPSGQIRNSLVSDGTIVLGKVNHSVISSHGLIDKGSEVIDSVVMPNVSIGKNCIISRAIVQDGVRIPDNATFIGGDKVLLITEEIITSLSEEI